MKVIKMFGKGKSLTTLILPDDRYIYAVLNSSIRLVNGIVDYHFMNDFENLKKIGGLDLIKTKNLVIPSYPHINEHADINFNHDRFLNILPKCYNANIHIYEMPSAPIKNKFEFLDVKWSVLETAILWFIARGFNKFEFVGITDTPGYSSLIYWEKPPLHQNTEWLSKNIELCKKILDDNNCTYTFN